MQIQPNGKRGLDERTSQAPKRVPSGALLGNDRELVIVHNGREYRLRKTQSGKLILTA
jgi:hemin uptake protein HemP